MGWEWPNLEVLTETEVIGLHEIDNVSKIFPLKAYGQKILEAKHKGGMRLDLMLYSTRFNYHWSGIRKDIELSLVEPAMCCSPAKLKAECLG